MRGEERLDLPPEGGIFQAGSIQEGTPFVCFLLQRSVEYLLDSLPTFGGPQLTRNKKLNQ